jgi:hypothetical protein
VLICSNADFAVLDIHHCGSVHFRFPARKMKETFHAVHMLLVLVQIRCTYMWYTCYEFGYFVCMECICCIYFCGLNFLKCKTYCEVTST